YVVATVRRPGTSIYHQIGTNDMTTDDTYYERGINLRHGYLTEYYVDDVEFIVKVPDGLKDVGVLLEPTTVVEKGITQAYEIQRRLRVWKPRRAAVMGAGTIGLLATLILRLRGLEVTTFALAKKPTLNSDLIEATGARYVSTQETGIAEEPSNMDHSIWCLKQRAIRRSCSRACARSQKTACSFFPVSRAATGPSKYQRTRSIWSLSSATK